MLFDDFGVARVAEQFVHFHALAQGDKLHFRCDDAFACVVHLGDVAAGFGAARAGDLVETQVGGVRVVRTFQAVFAGKAA